MKGPLYPGLVFRTEEGLRVTITEVIVEGTTQHGLKRRYDPSTLECIDAITNADEFNLVEQIEWRQK